MKAHPPRRFGPAILLLLWFTALVLPGCSTAPSDPSVSNGGGGAQRLSPVGSAKLSAGSAALARAIGSLTLFAPALINDPNNPIPRANILAAALSNNTTDFNGFNVTRSKVTEFQNGSSVDNNDIQINVRRGKFQVGLAYCKPAVRNADNTTTQVVLLGEIFGFPNSSNLRQSFFGYTGKATILYDKLPPAGSANILSIKFENLQLDPQVAGLGAGLQLPPLEGTLTRAGEHLTGALVDRSGGPGLVKTLTVDALIQGGAYKKIETVFDFFVQKGSFILNGQLSGGGTVETPSNPPQQVFVAPDGGFQSTPPLTTLPSVDNGPYSSIGTTPTQTFSLNMRVLGDLGEGVEFPVGAHIQSVIEALDGQGNPLPYSAPTSVQFGSNPQGIVTLLDVSGLFRADASGSVTLTYNDPQSQKTAQKAISILNNAPIKGLLFVSNEGDSQIVTYPFNITTGAVSSPTTTTAHTAQPNDLLVTRDKKFLLVASTGGVVDVYDISVTGTLTFRSSTNIGMPLRRMTESLLPRSSSDPMRFFAISRTATSDLLALSLNPASGVVTLERDVTFGAFFPIDIDTIDAGNGREIAFISGGDTSIWACDLPNPVPGVVNFQQFNLLNSNQLADVEVSLASGPILEVLDLGANKLRSLSIQTGQPLASVIDPTAATSLNVQSRPRGLAVDDLSDVAYFGSEGPSTVEGIQLLGPPTANSILPGSPYAASGSGTVTQITGSGNQLVFVLTSPQRTLQAFVQQSNLSLNALSSTTVPGTGSVQDLEAVILNN